MLKLVIAEDEELLREGLTTCINWNELGFELVGEASDGLEALELVERTLPDVVITDIKMPHMSGIELIEAVKKTYKEIKIIIISGHDDFEYARKAMLAGCSEYLLKPLNLKRLQVVVKAIGDEINEIKDNNQTARKKKRQSYFNRVLLQRQKKGLSEFLGKNEEYFYSKYYAVGILEEEDFPVISIDSDYLEIIDLDQRFEEHVLECLKSGLEDGERESIEILRSNNCERLICIMGESVDYVKRLIKSLNRIFDRKNEYTEQMELSFGNIYRAAKGLNRSYLDAKKISENRYMKNWEQILHTDGPASSTIKYMNYDAQALFFEIRSGKNENIVKYLDEFRDSLYRENITSYMQIIMIISNLYYELIKLPREMGGNIEDLIGEPIQYYQKIIQKRKRSEMVEQLKELCFIIHSFFENVSGGKMQGVIRFIHEYIEEHYSEEKLSMKDVADSAYISVSYLSIILKKETGKTFIEYLTEVRINKAKEFLKNSDMKSYEVAMACGYSSSAYFSTVFKGITGMSPSSYRKRAKD